MQVDRTAAKVGASLAGLPVSAMLVTTSLLELASADALSRQEGTDLVYDVLGPVMTATVVLLFGVLLVAPPLAFYLTFPEHRDAEPAVAGFAVGALVYGAGVAGLAWVGGLGSPFPGGYLRFGIWLALLFGGAAALGALGGDIVGPLFRTPEGEDGEHPRW